MKAHRAGDGGGEIKLSFLWELCRHIGYLMGTGVLAGLTMGIATRCVVDTQCV